MSVERMREEARFEVEVVRAAERLAPEWRWNAAHVDMGTAIGVAATFPNGKRRGVLAKVYGRESDSVAAECVERIRDWVAANPEFAG